jgi:hypothetical protein
MDTLTRLPLQDVADLRGGLAPYYDDWLAHSDYDDYWKAISIEEAHSRITVPAFNFGGWYDIFVGGTIRNYTRMSEFGATEKARNGQRLVLGPWAHSSMDEPMIGEHDFGARSSATAQDIQGQILRFYDHWLYGEDNGVDDESPIRIFVMGDNRWRTEDEWPLDRAEMVGYYLSSDGQANTLNGNGRLSLDTPTDEPPDVFLYNPIDPVPTSGGQLCCEPGFAPTGAFDQRIVETRPDVLVYTSEELDQDTEVTGPVIVTLFASSSAVDTDFTAKLVDIRPDGYARNLTDGIIRARYRTPQSPATLIEPGTVFEYTIDLWATSNVFKKYHRIRLEISSSNFPRFDRNTNTGGPIGTETDFVSAMQTVHHSAQYPSRITLPIIPRDYFVPF